MLVISTNVLSDHSVVNYWQVFLFFFCTHKCVTKLLALW